MNLVYFLLLFRRSLTRVHPAAFLSPPGFLMMQLLTAVAALGFVVGLIFLTGALGRWVNPWLVRRWGARGGMASPSGTSCQVGPKRRLHVAELEGRKFAILVGGPNDIMIALPENSKESHC